MGNLQNLLRLSSHRYVIFSSYIVAFAIGSATAENEQGTAATTNKPQNRLSQFLTSYCVDCHNAQSSEGERRFDQFSLPLGDSASVIRADEIVDQLTLKTMPPSDALQPTDEHRVALIKLLRQQIAEARTLIEGTGDKTVIRRLSNREYENTLKTLFGRRVDTLGLTLEFPKETTSENLDTIGSSLVTSGFLLDQYFQAASKLIDYRLGAPTIDPKDWHFKDNFVQYEELNGSHRSVFNFDFLCLYEQPNTDTRQGGYGHIEDFLEGVPVSGIYEIDVLVQAMHRDTHYDPKIFRIDFSEPFLLGIVPGDVTRGHIHYPQSIEPVLQVKVVPDDTQQWLSFRVWLEAGQTPRFIFPNGPYESRASVIELNRRYEKEFENPKQGVSRATLLREGKLPHLRIDEIKIHGPLVESNLRKEEVAVFGPEGFLENRAIQQLYGFAQKAFRRPLTRTDRSRIEAFYQDRLAQDEEPRTAALSALKMILCSPSFLYLSEITDEKNVELNVFDLATRISYSLWASPPDTILFEAARKNQLLSDDQIKNHVKRLLTDERSDAFYIGFLDSWLNLRSLGDLPPPRKFAREYYFENLPPLMKEEARRFFRHLIEHDQPVSELLMADYTFVNKSLAKLYELPEKDSMRLADGFQKVSVEGVKTRGGILAMAGVLTVSANGVDTSPVQRGAWILENILGTPPPPPPDEVPAIDANVSGSKTIREKLSLHRGDVACSGCHRKIDPLGFPLEHFDPIGRWRQKYPMAKDADERAAIDASGELATGETFADYQQFRKVLADTQTDELTFCLTRKLLEYSTGRHMGRVDEYEIADIISRAKKNGGGMRSLLMEVFSSKIFRSR
ncbi:DUF1592 domain-containing protein [Rhodopirellula sp.]|nr:DUF1592 domain-containing protein [Rhodopirellula sp.]MDB4678902.1 DUF1592 domain-containing protein [Rhodopirellula sp.]